MAGILGIDVGGENKTACVLLKDKNIDLSILNSINSFNDLEKLIDIIKENEVKLVAIDAPLGLPKFLKSITENEFDFQNMDKDKPINKHLTREVDLKLIDTCKKGMHWYMLAYISLKGILIKNVIKNKFSESVDVIEVYPGFNLKTKIDKAKNPTGYAQLVFEILKEKTNHAIDLSLLIDKIKNDHQVDAITATIIGYLKHIGSDKPGFVIDSQSEDIIYFINSNLDTNLK